MEFLFLELKKLSLKIFTLMIIIFFSNLFSQTNLKIGPCGLITGYAWCINGIIFLPENPESNKSQSKIKFCDGSKNIYYLEGLQLSENKFLEIGLKQKDVIENKSKYSYQYRNNDTTSCVEFIKFFVSVSIPIKLNGVELKDDEKENKLKNITMDKIISIVRKKSLWKVTIEITTL